MCGGAASASLLNIAAHEQQTQLLWHIVNFTVPRDGDTKPCVHFDKTPANVNFGSYFRDHATREPFSHYVPFAHTSGYANLNRQHFIRGRPTSLNATSCSDPYSNQNTAVFSQRGTFLLRP